MQPKSLQIGMQVKQDLDIKIKRMIVLKLNKENKELYVAKNPTTYMFAIEYGWAFTEIEVADDFILNTSTEIN